MRDSLAYLFRVTGRFSEAESLYLKALGKRKRLLGEDHPDTVVSVNNLASLYKNTGRMSEAEALFLDAVEINNKVLGADHIQTLISLNNLASTYHENGRLSDAEPIYSKVRDVSESLLSLEHADTLRSINNLALLRFQTLDFKSVSKAIEDLNVSLEAWSRRIQFEISAGSGDDLRSFARADNSQRDLSISAALSFPTHSNLGARALLLIKGVAGEADVTLNRMVTIDPRDKVRDSAQALRLAESQLHASYQSNDAEQVSLERRSRDDARRALFAVADLGLAFQPERITPDIVSDSLPSDALFLDYGIFKPVDFETGDRAEPHIALAVYRHGQTVQLLDLGPVSFIAQAIVDTSDFANTRRDLQRQHWLLREVLLDPVQDMLSEVDEVIVSPDGILARVNFSFLQDPE